MRHYATIEVTKGRESNKTERRAERTKEMWRRCQEKRKTTQDIEDKTK